MKTVQKILTLAAAVLFSLNGIAQSCCHANAGPNKNFCCSCVTIGGSPSGIDTCGAGCDSILYRWKPTTGLNNPNIANPCASPTHNTTYTLTVYAINSHSPFDTCCVSTSTMTVHFTANCCRSADPATEKQIVNSDVQIYPNPSEQDFNLELGRDLQNAEIRVYDYNGNILWQKTGSVSAGVLKIDMSGSARGIYIMRIRENNETIFSGKIILK